MPPPKDGGQTVVFMLNGDGAPYEFECSVENLSTLMLALQGAGRRAHEMRKNLPLEQHMGESVPLQMRAVAIARFPPDWVTLKIATKQGLPVTLSMDQDQATDLAKRLQRPAEG